METVKAFDVGLQDIVELDGIEVDVIFIYDGRYVNGGYVIAGIDTDNEYRRLELTQGENPEIVRIYKWTRESNG